MLAACKVEPLVLLQIHKCHFTSQMLVMALSVLESEIDIVKNEIQIPEAAGRLSIEELSEKSRRQDGKYESGKVSIY